jgi:hypothetical protein
VHGLAPRARIAAALNRTCQVPAKKAPAGERGQPRPSFISRTLHLSYSCASPFGP